ncbi:hypothetical protein AB7M18_000616 [Pseudomonas viridiflava]
MRFEEILASMRVRMALMTLWVGRAGLMLGPILGLLNLMARSIVPPYWQRVPSHRDAVQLAGDLLAAPAVQYFILIGFGFCLLWMVLWGVRIGLALCGWIISRRTAQ